ncbi:dihydrodipicolinate synthase family protein [Streptomyces sp. NPDC046371]|uniref:dihydrodipicolinate synthase family protein n=1 Tax=Streptomyces sp. NPDC046371 TaxID=3154916 RepID=UPI0033EACBF3
MAHAQDFTPHGIHVPLVTPFARDGRPDLDALAGLARSVLDDGAAGLVALGTTGEAAALDADERRAVVDTCAGVCRERGAQLVVGAGGGGTDAVGRELAALRRWPEARAALVTVPAFVRPSPEGVLAHFARLAADSPVPLVAYHIPYRTGRPLDAAALRAVGSVPGVVGVKYATGSVDDAAVALLGDPRPDFAVLAGDDAFASPMLALGASGGILTSAHLATGRFVELAEAWRAGDTARARALGHRLARLSSLLFAEPNPTVIKGVLHAQGRIPTPDVRLPLLPAGEASVAAALRELVEPAGPGADRPLAEAGAAGGR